MKLDPTDSILEVKDLCKHFEVRDPGLRRRVIGTVKACDQITFDLARGETLGVVGESGSGKSTLARTLLRVTRPTSGAAVFHGRRSVDLATASETELRQLRPDLQMIFQDPHTSLNPRFTVQQIIAEPLVIQGHRNNSELSDRVVSMMRRVGLRPEMQSRYPHAFSGGQRQRIGIARALISTPKLVIADEAVSALDVSVQAQIVNLLRQLQEELALTYIFIAHDLSIVRHIATRVAVMKAGKLVEIAPTDRLFSEPEHPYTRQLLDCALKGAPGFVARRENPSPGSESA